MNALSKLLLQRLQTGLTRSAIQTASAWAVKYRKMGNPLPGDWSWKHHPWTKEMHDSKADVNIGQKAAQMGFTETMLNLTFFAIDVLRQDVAYILPNKNPDAADFSKARFDSALSLSEHLTKLFSDTNNVGHKQAGNCNLYVRGSQSRIAFKSIATPKMFFDEVDEMNQENLPLALSRGDGQKESQLQKWYISTPTVTKFGINRLFLNSTQEHYFFQCPHGTHKAELTYPDCLIIHGDDEHDPKVMESHIICPVCKNKLDHETKAEWLDWRTCEWVPNFKGRSERGFHISQLYSLMVSPPSLAKFYFKSLKNYAMEQELWNSKAGLPHEVEGARITDLSLTDAIKAYNSGPRDGFNVMGVDVGPKRLHITIDSMLDNRKDRYDDLNVNSHARTIFEGTRAHFEDLDILMAQYKIRSCVIDAQPERHEAGKFAKRWGNRVYMCYYGNDVRGKTINRKEEAQTITVDRTCWLDCSLGRFKNKTIDLPVDTSLEYREHLKALVRVYVLDKNNNQKAKFMATDEDHFAHARNYSELAFNLSLGVGVNEDITDKVT